MSVGNTSHISSQNPSSPRRSIQVHKDSYHSPLLGLGEKGVIAPDSRWQDR